MVATTVNGHHYFSQEQKFNTMPIIITQTSPSKSLEQEIKEFILQPWFLGLLGGLIVLLILLIIFCCFCKRSSAKNDDLPIPLQDRNNFEAIRKPRQCTFLFLWSRVFSCFLFICLSVHVLCLLFTCLFAYFCFLPVVSFSIYVFLCVCLVYSFVCSCSAGLVFVLQFVCCFNCFIYDFTRQCGKSVTEGDKQTYISREYFISSQIGNQNYAWLVYSSIPIISTLLLAMCQFSTRELLSNCSFFRR